MFSRVKTRRASTPVSILATSPREDQNQVKMASPDRTHSHVQERFALESGTYRMNPATQLLHVQQYDVV